LRGQTMRSGEGALRGIRRIIPPREDSPQGQSASAGRAFWPPPPMIARRPPY